VFTFSPEASLDVAVPKVAARGEVRRIERSNESDGQSIGIQFRQHRFL
jgi:hypothetical protein